MTKEQREHKSREQRLRRMAARQGLTLQKSRTRDPHAPDYGKYFLIRETVPGASWQGRALVTSEWGVGLDDVEAHLTGRTPEPEPEVDRRVVCYSWDD